MKKYSIYFIACVVTLLVGCQKEDDPTPTHTQDPNAVVQSDSTESNAGSEEPGFNQQLAKKWDMNTASPSGRHQDVDIYVSIEFTQDGQYFIEKSDNSFENGTYEISDERRIIELSDFGTIDIISLDEQSFVFTLTTLAEPDTSQDVTSVAVDPIELSDSDRYILGAWNTNSFYYVINGDTIRSSDPEYSALTGLDDINVYFTQYGTYLVEYKVNGEATEKQKNYWQWSDDSKTSICFADWTVALEHRSSVCSEINRAEINKIDENRFELVHSQGYDVAGSGFQFKISYDMVRAE